MTRLHVIAISFIYAALWGITDAYGADSNSPPPYKPLGKVSVSDGRLQTEAAKEVTSKDASSKDGTAKDAASSTSNTPKTTSNSSRIGKEDPGGGGGGNGSGGGGGRAKPAPDGRTTVTGKPYSTLREKPDGGAGGGGNGTGSGGGKGR